MPGPDGIGLLAARAREGDARVVAALEEAGRALGTALAGAVNLLDPAAVVLGGAYAELGGSGWCRRYGGSWPRG
ncbi:ROK family protein [Nonomuraea ferruginea]